MELQSRLFDGSSPINRAEALNRGFGSTRTCLERGYALSKPRLHPTPTPHDCFVRFAVVVAFHCATLATRPVLPLYLGRTFTGWIAPASSWRTTVLVWTQGRRCQAAGWSGDGRVRGWGSIHAVDAGQSSPDHELMVARDCLCCSNSFVSSSFRNSVSMRDVFPSSPTTRIS